MKRSTLFVHLLDNLIHEEIFFLDRRVELPKLCLIYECFTNDIESLPNHVAAEESLNFCDPLDKNRSLALLQSVANL